MSNVLARIRTVTLAIISCIAPITMLTTPIVTIIIWTSLVVVTTTILNCIVVIITTTRLDNTCANAYLDWPLV